MSATLSAATSEALSRGQRRPALQTRSGFEKSHDLVGAEHDPQRARLPRVRDRAGTAASPSAYIFQAQPLGRLAKYPLNFETALT
jgi:hypothetical protein